jgi:hypothetical protein
LSFKIADAVFKYIPTPTLKGTNTKLKNTNE